MSGIQTGQGNAHIVHLGSFTDYGFLDEGILKHIVKITPLRLTTTSEPVSMSSFLFLPFITSVHPAVDGVDFRDVENFLALFRLP